MPDRRHRAVFPSRKSDTCHSSRNAGARRRLQSWSFSVMVVRSVPRILFYDLASAILITQLGCSKCDTMKDFNAAVAFIPCQEEVPSQKKFRRNGEQTGHARSHR